MCALIAGLPCTDMSALERGKKQTGARPVNKEWVIWPDFDERETSGKLG